MLKCINKGVGSLRGLNEKIKEKIYIKERQSLVSAIGLIMLISLVVLLHFTFFIIYVANKSFDMAFMNFSAGICCVLSIYFILFKDKFLLPIYIFIFSIIYYAIYSSYFLGYEKNAVIILPIVVVGISNIYELKKKDLFIIVTMLIFTYFILLYFKYNVPAKYIDEFKYIEVVNTFIAFFCSIFAMYAKTLSTSYLKIFNQEQLDMLSKQANKDFLTGLWNRRYLMSQLSNHKIYNNYYVVIADIDFFKKINDIYGHNAGDFVLANISKIFSDYFKNDDIICRWGGEEFVFIVQNTNEKELRDLIKSLLKGIANTPFIHNNKTILLTISFGVSYVSKDINFETAMSQADTALYLSKSNGRNQVTFYKDIK